MELRNKTMQPVLYNDRTLSSGNTTSDGCISCINFVLKLIVLNLMRFHLQMGTWFSSSFDKLMRIFRW